MTVVIAIVTTIITPRFTFAIVDIPSQAFYIPLLVAQSLHFDLIYHLDLLLDPFILIVIPR